MATGLNNALKPKFGIKTAKYGSDNLEGFQTAAEKTLLKEALNVYVSSTRIEKQVKYTMFFRD